MYREPLCKHRSFRDWRIEYSFSKAFQALSSDFVDVQRCNPFRVKTLKGFLFVKDDAKKTTIIW
jgi:hypothetical protein